MTPLQEQIAQITLGVNAQARVSDEGDFARKFADIGIDSLETMSVILAVTEKFAITVPDAEFDRINTLGELVALVERELAAAGKA